MMSTDNDDRRVLPFAGLTRYDSDVSVTELPENVWRQQSALRYWAMDHQQTEDPDVSDLPEDGLHTLIPQLPRAATATAGWKHPRTGEWIETEKHNAIINPETAEEILDALQDEDEDDAPDPNGGYSEVIEHDDGALEVVAPEEEPSDEDDDTLPGDHALYNIPTDDYEVINPSSFLNPLVEVLQDNDLGDQCFGEVRLSRGGGRATLDLYFNSKTVEAPSFDAERAPIVTGLSIQWDFFGDWAVRASGCGIDWACENYIRQITEREIVKHAGDVDNRVDWAGMWEDLLEALDLKTDQLSQIIQEASEVGLDLSELPDDIADGYRDPWTALYAYSGLPEYLAEYAGDSLRSDAENPYEPSWWEIHRGATDAITHKARGTLEGSSIENYNRLANDMIMNPASMEGRLVEAYQEAREEDQATLEGEGGGVAEIQGAFETVREKKEEYEERQDEIRQLVMEEAE